MFITQQSLENLKLYKYTGVDKSLCARYILSPYFWEPFLKKCVPTTIAPNLITLIGGIFMLIPYFLTVMDSPTGQEEVSPFTALVTALCIFLYQTADNLDGKQARRTKSSSALGELFDHGVDTFTMGIFALIAVVMFHFDVKIQLFLFVMLLSVFYMSHWEEYHTNSLVLGYVINPTELQIVCIIGLLFFVICPECGYSTNKFGMYFIFILSVAANCIYIHGTLTHIKKNGNYTMIQSLKHALPYLTFFAISIFIIVICPASFLQQHFHLMALLILFVNAFITQRLIVHRICKEPVAQFHVILIVYFVFAIFCCVSSMELFVLDYQILALIAFVCAFVIEAYFIYEIVTSFASYLKIKVFSIVPKEDSSEY